MSELNVADLSIEDRIGKLEEQIDELQAQAERIIELQEETLEAIRNLNLYENEGFEEYDT